MSEKRLAEATALLERAARIIENDDWRDAYDAFRSGVELAPDGSAKYSTLCYEGDCAKMTGRARPCPIHDQHHESTRIDELENELETVRGERDLLEMQKGAITRRLIEYEERDEADVLRSAEGAGLAIVSEADKRVLETSGAVHQRWLESYVNIIVPTQADPQAFAWAQAELARREQ